MRSTEQLPREKIEDWDVVLSKADNNLSVIQKDAVPNA